MLNNPVITFAGNLTADPELRTTPSGKHVADFRVLVNRRTKQGDTWVDADPTPFQCQTWETTATHLAASVHKGDRVMVHGHLETETWTDKDTHEPRSRVIVRVDEVAVSLAWTAAILHHAGAVSTS